MYLSKKHFLGTFFIFYTMVAVAQTGIGTTSPVNKLQVETNVADPATSGSAANGNLRLSGSSGSHVLDFGLSSSSNYSWLQSRDRTNYANTRFLLLNPRGGNIGIGNTAPSSTLEIGSSDGTIPGYLILNATTSGTGVEGGEINIKPAPVTLSPAAQTWTIDQVSNASVPRLRIFPSVNGEPSGLTIRDNGNLGIGWANPASKLHIYTSDNTGIYIESITTDNNGIIRLNANTASNWANDWHEFLIFEKQGSRIGQIIGINNGSGVNYATASDYRLKTDLQDFNGLGLVNKIKTYDFAWINGGSRMFGVMAHELQSVVPYAVSGVKDAVDKEGKIIPQTVDYSKIVPVLIKAIQEQDALLQEQKKQIDALNQRLEKLENKK